MTDESVQDGAEPTGRVRRAREEIIEAMADSAERYGTQRSVGRLYGLLYFAGEPRSLDDLAAESGYAKSTVSTAMATLERAKLVDRRSIPGEGKRVFFEAEEDLWCAFQQFLDTTARQEIETMSGALEEAARLLDADDSKPADEDLVQVQQLQKTYDQLSLFLELLTGESLEALLAVADKESEIVGNPADGTDGNPPDRNSDQPDRPGQGGPP